jgi:hypothetical protein
MSEAECGVADEADPGSRFAHPGYSCYAASTRAKPFHSAVAAPDIKTST